MLELTLLSVFISGLACWAYRKAHFYHRLTILGIELTLNN
jgi:hypothetical protein